MYMTRLTVVQTSNFSCAESNANKQNPLFETICITFGPLFGTSQGCFSVYNYKNPYIINKLKCSLLDLSYSALALYI